MAQRQDRFMNEHAPEAHEIKSFEDVVRMYQNKAKEDKQSPAKTPAPQGAEEVAFYNFQRKHPAYNHMTLEQYRQQREKLQYEPEIEENERRRKPLWEQEKQENKAPTIPIVKNAGITVVTHATTQKTADEKSIYTYEQQVQDTKMAFIKYCVQLYQINVVPMLKKLKREDIAEGDQAGKKASTIDMLKKSMFVKSLQNQKKEKDRETKMIKEQQERLKLNNYYQDVKDLDIKEYERLIMEEEAYYKKVDYNKLHNDDEHD